MESFFKLETSWKVSWRKELLDDWDFPLPWVREGMVTCSDEGGGKGELTGKCRAHLTWANSMKCLTTGYTTVGVRSGLTTGK